MPTATNPRVVETLLPPLRFLTEPGTFSVANGLLGMRLTGPNGRIVVVDSSVDLQSWTPIQTTALPPGGLDLAVPMEMKPNQFFRARRAP